MKFAQKLACAMLLVLAFSFSAGGCIFLYGEFADTLANVGEQNLAQHGTVCHSLEDKLLTLRGRGDAVTDALLAQFGASLAETGPAGYSLAVSRSGQTIYTCLPQDLPLEGLSNGQMKYCRQNGDVYAVYRSDLLEGLSLFSAFPLTPLYQNRGRSMQRFLGMEAAVLACASLAAAAASRRLTRPLALLTAASGEIAAGAYDRRTGVQSSDEIGQLSASFDHMAAAVQEKVAALELSVQQREEFMGAFTHELKTPMTSIIGYSDMLRSLQCDPAEQKEAATSIFREAKRLESLSLKLLQLLHLDEEPLALGPVSIQRVLQALRPAAEPVCRSYGVKLHLPPGSTAAVQGDADLLVDLLYNLIQNAAKASAPGQAIEVSCTPRQSAAGFLLAVADHGRGIPPQALARVTEPFYMVDKSRARKSGGSGLGLALCARIAAAHGSELKIESPYAPGQPGTRISLELAPAGEEVQPL